MGCAQRELHYEVMKMSESREEMETLIIKIDCTENHPAEMYFDTGDVTVEQASVGTYRQAAGKPLSRFGYRFQITNVGAPHKLIVRYPDDRRRFMCVVDGTCYDMSTGVVTGFQHPVSGTMQTLEQVFWPRWEDCSITFMTWGHDEPAAAAEIEVHELDSLPVEENSTGEDTRVFGIQYEDPCGTGASEGAMDRITWGDRIATYAAHTGQNLLAYPLAWYHGPHFPSETEPSQDFDVVVGRDRKQHVRWTSEPTDWVTLLLDRLHESGIAFQGNLTLLRLGSLMKQMNIDLDAIQGGAETINNMLWCDNVQAGTMDWTPIYNVRNYPEIVDGGKPFGGGPEQTWAYGERVGQGYHGGPIFNPLHPTVQDAVTRFVGEIGERYGSHPAFTGIAINMWGPTIIWYGSIHAGYDDYTVALFEQETGIGTGGDPDDPNRFSKRYEYLSFVCRDAWINWRCVKIREFILRIRDALQRQNPNLRLTLNLWSEPFIPLVLGNGTAAHQVGARKSTTELYREAGLDIQLFDDVPGIDLDLQLDGGNRDRSPSMNEERPLEAFTMFRDHDYLDKRTLSDVAKCDRSGAFVFNAWHEAWGDHRWFPCDDDDEQAKELAVMGGKPVEGIFRMNSSYPEDGFWWDSQLRITPAFPPGRHMLEPFAHALAEFDALKLTQGGLFLDKAHTREIREFATAFRTLPNRKFETIGTCTDPVAVRTVIHNGVRYIYAVNRSFHSVDLSLDFGKWAGGLSNLSTRETVQVAETFQLSLKPYELWAFSCSVDAEVKAFLVTVPDTVLRVFASAVDEAERTFESACKAGKRIPGANSIAGELRNALKEQRTAWLRHALTGYAARKAREVAGIDGEPLRWDLVAE